MVAEIVEAVGRLILGFLGLRYLFSSKYRNDVHKNWGSQSGFAIAVEVFEAILGLFFLGVIIYAVIYIAVS